MRATALFMAEPMPACWSSTAASTAAVSGATVKARPHAQDDDSRQYRGDVVVSPV